MSQSKKDKPLSLPPENPNLKLKGSSRTSGAKFDQRGQKVINQVNAESVGKVTLGSKPIVCPKCQTENLPTNKFCIECGTLLIFTCPVCESETPITSKFCSGCGQEISVLIKMKKKEFDENDKDS